MAGITKQRLKELVKEVMVEETEYQAFFQKALDKAGKSIPSMSDEEKKAFFDKIDAAWNGKGEKNESVVKESIDTNYWIKYNKNPNGESSQSKKSNNFEYTFKDALNDWNSEGEDVVSGSDAQRIKKLAKEFFDKEGYITYNIVYAMIMQS
jgi:hypothetical protein